MPRREARKGKPLEIITLRTSGDCPDERSCTSIHKLDIYPERRYVITKRETDPEITAAFAAYLQPGEQVGWIESELIPEVG